MTGDEQEDCCELEHMERFGIVLVGSDLLSSGALSSGIEYVQRRFEF